MFRSRKLELSKGQPAPLGDLHAGGALCPGSLVVFECLCAQGFACRGSSRGQQPQLQVLCLCFRRVRLQTVNTFTLLCSATCLNDSGPLHHKGQHTEPVEDTRSHFKPWCWCRRCCGCRSQFLWARISSSLCPSLSWIISKWMTSLKYFPQGFDIALQHLL